MGIKAQSSPNTAYISSDIQNLFKQGSQTKHGPGCIRRKMNPLCKLLFVGRSARSENVRNLQETSRSRKSAACCTFAIPLYVAVLLTLRRKMSNGNAVYPNIHDPKTNTKSTELISQKTRIKKHQNGLRLVWLHQTALQCGTAFATTYSAMHICAIRRSAVRRTLHSAGTVLHETRTSAHCRNGYEP